MIGYMIDGRNSGIDKYLCVFCVFYDAGIHADILTKIIDLRACLAPFKEKSTIPGLMHPQKQYKGALISKSL